VSRRCCCRLGILYTILYLDHSNYHNNNAYTDIHTRVDIDIAAVPQSTLPLTNAVAVAVVAISYVPSIGFI
jgi:hypothetical protein